MKSIDKSELLMIGEKHRIHFLDDNNVAAAKASLRRALAAYLGDERLAKRCVLGMDIYKYSSYQTVEQICIPVLFHELYDAAVEKCFTEEAFFFMAYDKEQFREQFMSTGDGGFQVFNKPIDALVFALYFQSILNAYNTFSVHRAFRAMIGEIVIRYTITYDDVSSFMGSFYGSAIIINARVLARDQLNRCLIDDKVAEWFNIYVGGIESLLRFSRADLLKALPDPPHRLHPVGRSLLFPEGGDRAQNRFLSINKMKLGWIESKSARIDIHNLAVQVNIVVSVRSESDLNRTKVVSLGNLNASGI